MIEKALAMLTIAVCLLLLLRLAIGERRRMRIDASVRAAFDACRRAVSGPMRRRSARREAARMADDAIRRARRRGNVYEVESFRSPRKPH